MAEQSVKDRVGGAISQAKRRVGVETPLAADDDGRVGIVRGALRAFGEGDLDGFLDTLKDDVNWEAPDGKRFPGAGTHSGRDAVKAEFLGAVSRTYTSFGFRPESFLDADEENSVMAIGAIKADGVEGASIDVPTVMLWEFEGNEAARVVIFTDSSAFPKPLTEKDLEQDSDDEDGGESKSDTGGESKSDTGSESKSDASGESKSDASGESKSDASGESKSDTSGESKSDTSGESKTDTSGESKSEGREDGGD